MLAPRSGQVPACFDEVRSRGPHARLRSNSAGAVERCTCAAPRQGHARSAHRIVRSSATMSVHRPPGELALHPSISDAERLAAHPMDSRGAVLDRSAQTPCTEEENTYRELSEARPSPTELLPGRRHHVLTHVGIIAGRTLCAATACSNAAVARRAEAASRERKECAQSPPRHESTRRGTRGETSRAHASFAPCSERDASTRRRRRVTVTATCRAPSPPTSNGPRSTHRACGEPVATRPEPRYDGGQVRALVLTLSSLSSQV